MSRADSTEYTLHPPSQLPPGVLRLSIPSSSHCSLSPNLSCRALSRSGVGLVQVLGLALLAVLTGVNPILPPMESACTYRPLGELELALASSLGGNPLVLLERATDSTGCDRNVAVVAIQSVRTSFNCDMPGPCRVRSAYERPAAFHANAIVMVGGVISGVAVVGRWSLWLLRTAELARESCGCGSADASHVHSHPPVLQGSKDSRFVTLHARRHHNDLECGTPIQQYRCLLRE